LDRSARSALPDMGLAPHLQNIPMQIAKPALGSGSGNSRASARVNCFRRRGQCRVTRGTNFRQNQGVRFIAGPVIGPPSELRNCQGLSSIVSPVSPMVVRTVAIISKGSSFAADLRRVWGYARRARIGEAISACIDLLEPFFIRERDQEEHFARPRVLW
jgi:hypothetical protein